MRKIALLTFLFAMPMIGVAQAPAPLPVGRVISKVACLERTDQTYALYVPSRYSADKVWPVIFIFEPLARGPLPVGLMKEAAERYGYIVIGSNNSKNGPLKDSFEAIQALWHDAHQRFSIDSKRIYFAGFSGGARAAIALANRCGGCVAGVMASGAGFPTGLEPAKSVKVPIYFTVGDIDFNFAEILLLEPKLKEAGFSFHVRRFEGPHGWPAKEVWFEAFNWLNLQAMKTGTITKDGTAVEAGYKAALANAEASLDAHREYEANRAYEQAVADYSGLTDTSEAQRKSKELSALKPVRDGYKREREETGEQMRLATPISAHLQSLVSDPMNQTTELQAIRDLFDGLRRQARSERISQSLVAKRAIAQELAQAFELGADMLESKQFQAALGLYEVIAENGNKGWGAHLQKARAYLGLKNKAKALEEIRAAIQAGLSDPAMLDQPEFAELKTNEDFKTALASLHPTEAE